MLQNVGTGTEVPTPEADPFCVEFDKTHQNITEFGLVEFLALEPARVAAAAPKCFYFQHDHWTGSIVEGQQPETVPLGRQLLLRQGEGHRRRLRERPAQRPVRAGHRRRATSSRLGRSTRSALPRWTRRRSSAASTSVAGIRGLSRRELLQRGAVLSLLPVAEQVLAFAAALGAPNLADGTLQAFADTMIPGKKVSERTSATRFTQGDRRGRYRARRGAGRRAALYHHPLTGFDMLEPAFLADLTRARSSSLGSSST